MFKPKFTIVLVAALTAVLSSASFAQAPKSFDDRMAELEAQITLMKKQGELNTLLASSVTPEFGRMPTILTIIGFDNKMSAKLLMPNGTVSTVAEGDMIRPGMKVAAIAPRQVILTMTSARKDKSKQAAQTAVSLEFATRQVPGLPGFPGGPGGSFSGGMPPGMPVDMLPFPPSVMPTPLAGGTRPIAPPGAIAVPAGVQPPVLANR